ncbi:hypothetical protein ACPV4O_27690 [Vibrio owensii]|uniref:hypothetical protein n=1 Tax=Vibrio owensii TaxID=696485 RepID=UPI00406800DD
MFKSLIKYIVIVALVGIGFSSVDEIHYQITKSSRIKDLAEAQELADQVRSTYIIDSKELFPNNLPDRYYNPENDLFFSLQSFSDLGSTVEMSGVLTNRGTDIWRNVYVDFEAFDDDGNVISKCNVPSGELLPTYSEGLITRCPKVEKFKAKSPSKINMRIKWNFHGQRVVTEGDK